MFDRYFRDQAGATLTSFALAAAAVVAGIVGVSTLATGAAQAGRLDANPKCSDLGYQYELKVDPPGPGTFSDGTLTVTITVQQWLGPLPKVFSWTSNIGVDAVIAKAGALGHGIYVYDPESTGDSGLTTPGTGQNAVSHISICYDLQAATSTPTASSTHTPSATNTPDPTSTNSPEPTSTSTPVATETSEPSVTPTVPPTQTSTVEPTITNTPEPTSTNTPDPTSTNTPEPTHTNTPEPTNTNTPDPTSTNTPEPTHTNTPEPTNTNTPDPTSTNTPEPTHTNTPEPTNTNTPDPTSTNTPEPTNTNTPSPTSTATLTATGTPQGEQTPTPTSTPDDDADPTPTRTATRTATATSTAVNPSETPEIVIQVAGASTELSAPVRALPNAGEGVESAAGRTVSGLAMLAAALGLTGLWYGLRRRAS